MKPDVKVIDYSRQRILLKIVMALIAVAAITISVIMLATETRFYSNFNSKMNNYLFIIGLLIIFMAELILPAVVEKIFKIRISPVISFVFIVHCFGGTFLGNVANMYYIVPFWDKVMHFLLGLNLSMMGLAGIDYFTRKMDSDISPLFIAVVVLFTGIALSTVWEVFEFLVDVLFDMNMQGYAVKKTGELLVGQSVIMDTMVDILLDIAGAILIAVPVYFSYKHKKHWHKLCQVTRKYQ